jgi:hypothetical protein
MAPTSRSAGEGPRLVDSVTLRHFGAIERMTLLEARLAGFPEPRWAGAVRSELLAGIGRPECDAVLAASFLGQPHEIGPEGLADVFRLQIALRGGTGSRTDSTRDLGEAESIYLADRFNGAFITDDAAAYDFARRKLGSNRVFDTVDLLREAVGSQELSPSEAQHAADAIRNSGRHLRRVHPPTMTAADFAP